MAIERYEGVPMSITFQMTNEDALKTVIEVLDKRHKQVLSVADWCRDCGYTAERERYLFIACQLENFLQDLEVPGYEFT